MYGVVPTGFSSYVHSLIYKGLESTLFLFLPLTKLPHPNTIYRVRMRQLRQRPKEKEG